MYTLQVNFTEDQLEMISQTMKKVILVKEAKQGSSSNIAWLAFSPMQFNAVTWETAFSVYASTTVIEKGATIKMSSNKEATKGHLYKFEKNYFKDAGESSKGTNTYSILNTMKDRRILNFGLAQTAIVNGVNTFSPISAIPATYNDAIDLTPVEKISIFLQASLNNGTVISTVSGSAKELDFTTNDALAVKYDSINNVFVSDNLQQTAFYKRLSGVK